MTTLQQTIDQLCLEIFGVEPSKKEEKKPIIKERIENNPILQSAKYSDLMTMAHNINRKNGKSYVKGCNCESCCKSRQFLGV